MLGFLTAAYTLVGKMILNKRNATPFANTAVMAPIAAITALAVMSVCQDKVICMGFPPMSAVPTALGFPSIDVDAPGIDADASGVTHDILGNFGHLSRSNTVRLGEIHGGPVEVLGVRHAALVGIVGFAA